ncbi:MAG: hypothetical protein K8F56_18030, partial [Rhodocyclaceae bacterium]|nr:hypothetical protein [Rhodocyclaceae bacterium]
MEDPLEIVSYCIDVGTVEVGPGGGVGGSTFAWGRVDSGRRERRGRLDVRFSRLADLQEELRNDVAHHRRVALGVEAPMWTPLAKTFDRGTLFRPRFGAEKGHEWYLQAGASAAVRATQLAFLALEPLVRPTGRLRMLTRFRELESTDPNADSPSLLVWEAFVAGDFKPVHEYGGPLGGRKDRIDAFCAAREFAELAKRGDLDEIGESSDGPVLARPQDNATLDQEGAVSTWSLVADLLRIERPATSRCYVVGRKYR